MADKQDFLNREVADDFSEMEDKYLTFWIDKQLFSISIKDIEQIVSVQIITSVPNFPNYAKGIINLRGSIIPIIDMRIRLGRLEKEYDTHTCIIVIRIGRTFIGFVVDEVNEVVTIKADKISALPEFQQSNSEEYIAGAGKIDEKIILMLNTRKLLSEDQIKVLTQSSK